MIRNTARSPHHDTHQKRINKHEQIAMMTTLEKCNQMNRDDKTFIRRKLREYDDEVIGIFQRQRKPINYQQLQNDLRKLAVKFKNSSMTSRVSNNKENNPGLSDNSRSTSTFKVHIKKNVSLSKVSHDRKDSCHSVKSPTNLDIASPANKNTIGLNWFNKLQHKLKFKDQVKDNCTPIESHESQRVERNIKQLVEEVKNVEIEEQMNVQKRKQTTKQIKDKILERNRMTSLDIDIRQRPCIKVSLPTPQQPLMFSFKNGMRMSLHNVRQSFAGNISAVADVSPVRSRESLNETDRKLLFEMEMARRSNLKRRSLDHATSTVFKSQYDIDPGKVELLKQLTIFKNRYAQDILSYFFQSSRKLLNRHDFINLMIDLLQQMNVTVRAADTLEQFVSLIIGQEQFISPVMLGNSLEIIAPAKETESRVLFSQVCKNSRKVLELDDLLAFLRQHIQTPEQLTRAQHLAYELFYVCSKDGKLSYWDLYLTESSPQFRELWAITN